MKIIIDISEKIYDTIMADEMPTVEQMSAIVTRIYQGTPYDERPKGKWIIGETYDCHSDIVKTYTCPFCGKKEYSNYPYCHCGADMRGDV